MNTANTNTANNAEVYAASPDVYVVRFVSCLPFASEELQRRAPVRAQATNGQFVGWSAPVAREGGDRVAAAAEAVADMFALR